MTDGNPGTGSVLVAAPILDDDPFFGRSVIFLFNHSSNGAGGIDVTKAEPTGVGRGLFDNIDPKNSLPVEQKRLYAGGPELLPAPMVLLLITDNAGASPDATPIGDSGFSMAGIWLDAEGHAHPEKFSSGKLQNAVVAAGCGGWGPGQIESELRQKFWAVAPVTLDSLLAVPPTDRWSVAAQAAGLDIADTSPQPKVP